MGRRWLLLLGVVSISLGGLARPVVAAEVRALSVQELVAEPEVFYDIAFLWFDRLAEGRASFTAGDRPGTYRAVLEARTLGVAAWLTQDRVQRYTSVMEIGPDGFLRSLVHESMIIKGDKNKRREKSKRYSFDFQRREVRLKTVSNGTSGPEQIYPMGEEAPNDILTAFYNFRMGAFGPLRPASRYIIPTFDRKGKGTIVVETAPDGPRTNPFFPKNGLLCRAIVDPEIFDTGDGAILFWFDHSGHPPRGIVEKVIGLGDVKGTARPQVIKPKTDPSSERKQ